MESATVWGGEQVKFPAWSARVSAIRNLVIIIMIMIMIKIKIIMMKMMNYLDTVVLGGATQREVESGPGNMKELLAKTQQGECS